MPIDKSRELNIAIVIVLTALFLFLAAASYFYLTSPATIEFQQEQEKIIQQRNDDREFQRLRRKHGYPGAVIYDGKEAYYYRNGKKCRFI